MPPSRASTLPQAPPPSGLRGKDERLDVHSMFVEFNHKFFANSLQGVYVEYSSRMTLCAGTCMYRGAMGGCRIALSEPLLLRRPPTDTRDTLLHEMIHASLFLKHGVRRDGPDGHGPLFLSEADRVNRLAGSNITVYHTFNDEVDAQRTHWWRCRLCGRVVKRAMNRPPGPSDTWWDSHAASCGGSFEKTHEPPPKPPPAKTPRLGAIAVGSQNADADTTTLAGGNGKPVLRVHRIDEMLSRASQKPLPKPGLIPAATLNSSGARDSQGASKKRHIPAAPRARSKLFGCPICNVKFDSEAAVSMHLDAECLAPAFQSQPSLEGEAAQSSIQTSEHRIDLVDTSPSISRRMRLVNGDVHTVRRREESTTVASVGPGHGAEVSKGDVPGCDERTPSILGTPPREVVSLVDSDDDHIDTAADEQHAAEAVCPRDDLNARLGALRSRFMQDDVLDFAIGSDSAFLPTDVVEALNSVPRPELHPCQTDPLPDLPFRSPVSHAEAMQILTDRVGLWHPGRDPSEAPFATAAARRGMSASEFMTALVDRCSRDKFGLVLSRAALRLLRGAEHTGVVRGDEGVLCANRDPRNSKLYSGAPHGEKPTSRRERVAVDMPSRDMMPMKSDAPHVVQAEIGLASPEPRKTGNVILGDLEHVPDQARLPMAHTGSGHGIINLETSGNREAVAGTRGNHVHYYDSKSTHPADSRRSAHTTTCPMCEAQIPREKIDAHLELCLAVDMDNEEEIVEEEIVAEVPPREKCVKQSIPSDLPRLQPAFRGPSLLSSTEKVACPICGSPFARNELETHTASCLQMSGLGGAF